MLADNRLLIAALGGVNEIGKNMYLIQYDQDIVVIDCGSKFPNENLPGIDLIVPDVTYLQENQDKVRALIVTHGHEDHIGGIPYLLKQINIPVYGTKLTIELIKIKLKEHNLLRDAELHLIDADSTIQAGSIQASFFTTVHSIPDCLGVFFKTPEGNVVHTGDFKFDMSPVSGPFPDLHRMAEIGKQGVKVLLSESTNAERPGFTPSERLVGGHILDAFARAKQQVFISTFASNVNRVQQVIDAAVETGRKLVLLGRSMINVVSVAKELGFLHMPEDLLIEAGETERYPAEEIAVLCTGSQGEPMAALSRLANSLHPKIEILPGDTVIIAAGAIPGNERNLSQVIDNLYVLGANVIYGSGSATGMHVSGHGSQEELKLMMTLMKPQYLIPIHGEFRMLHQHRQLAESVGIPMENVFIVQNGETIQIAEGRASLGPKVPSGNSLVDGLVTGDVGNIVLRDRKKLSSDGMLIIVMTLSKNEKQMLAAPEVISRGFVYVKDSEELMNQIRDTIMTTVNELTEIEMSQWGLIKQMLKDNVGQFIYSQTKRRPMILPIIIEV
ncbi:ribonuclease J [Paenibacillus polymyxa]|jgi:ribonuclease J|uniref:Ribonuclease J n=1 Tax=Paenibacillus polymyxa TaxID=1406 RepID=A0A378XPK3_PAEPO|nr:MULTISPECIES: ribonuclease J [Paenibacillus]AUS24965.1 ribonuclease J [Paenibacillus polymyxa]KAF6615285.1 ribonuclease J [Paenibacillus sp. EKM101P]KAF6618887.1 ribonuclease J [Paenibacillus sp. EKM102P]KAF6627245.1 ribonuclease J [Paenibacillus sp. EKM10P]KAF6643644.1 ribonuclease J [Paenibacillus sp. EKM11P]